MQILKKLNSLQNDRFFKAVTVLAGGTALSQLIGIFVLPLLTRYYSAEDFSAYSVYNSILAIFSVVICLRLDIAIAMPKSRQRAKLLLLGSVVIAFILSLALYLVFEIFKHQLFSLLNQPELIKYSSLLVISIFALGCFNAIQTFLIRERMFSVIARSKIERVVLGSITQLGCGFLAFGIKGLILGLFVNSITGVRRLFLNSALSWSDFILRKRRHFFLVLKKYSNFLKYSSVEALANISASQLPILIMAFFLSGAELGFLLLATKLLQAPIVLIGKAIAQVYLSEAPTEYRNNTLYSFTLSKMKQLLFVSILPFTVLAIWAVDIFEFAFGESWGGAGEYAKWMIPCFLMQLVSSPMSMSLHIMGQQKKAMILHITGLILRVSFIFIAEHYSDGLIIPSYALSGFLFYATYGIVILKITKNNQEKI